MTSMTVVCSLGLLPAHQGPCKLKRGQILQVWERVKATPPLVFRPGHYTFRNVVAYHDNFDVRLVRWYGALTRFD